MTEAQRAHQPGSERVVWAQLEALSQGAFSSRKLAAPRLTQPEEPIRAMKMRIQLQRPSTLVGRRIPIVREGVDESQIGDDRRRQRIELDGLFQLFEGLIQLS